MFVVSASPMSELAAILNFTSLRIEYLDFGQLVSQNK